MNMVMVMPPTVKNSMRETPKQAALQSDGASFQSLLDDSRQVVEPEHGQQPDLLSGSLDKEALINELTLLISEAMTAFDEIQADGEAVGETGETEPGTQFDILSLLSGDAAGIHGMPEVLFSTMASGQSSDGDPLLESANSQIRELLVAMKGNPDTPKLAAAVMQLIKTATALDEQLSEMPTAYRQAVINGETKESRLLAELLVTIGKTVKKEAISERQTHIAEPRTLATNAVKWLTDLAGQEPTQQKQPSLGMGAELPFAAVSTTPGSMTKLEQFLLHSQQTGQISGEASLASTDKQLIEKLEKMMSANRLTSLQNGNSQLHIRINPENLGDMTVRFSRIDGEMMVKILVTTAAAKEMLDKNMGQLRHMFSPHQVIVDKQDLTMVQSTSVESQEQEHGEQLGEQSGNTSEKEGNHSGSEANFEMMFEEILLNMKV